MSPRNDQRNARPPIGAQIADWIDYACQFWPGEPIWMTWAEWDDLCQREQRSPFGPPDAWLLCGRRVVIIDRKFSIGRPDYPKCGECGSKRL